MSGAPTILVVEDDPAIASSLVRSLRAAGYVVELETDGDAGMQAALKRPFDAIVLDLMLPGKHGFELLRAWSNRISAPVLVLTADSDLDARLQSFELGAVDWMSKPFFADEVIARLRLRLRLRDVQEHRCVEWADVRVDLDGRSVLRGDATVHLTPVELNVLVYLVQRPGRVVTRAQLIDGALPVEGDRAEDTLSSHVSRIRRKLGREAAAGIQTVRGFGYKFEPPRGSR